MKEGAFFAIRTKLPQTCQSKVCELAHAILGKDSWLMFTGNANKKGLEFTAAVLDRKITETIKFSKLELYVKVNDSVKSRYFIYLPTYLPTDRITN